MHALWHVKNKHKLPWRSWNNEDRVSNLWWKSKGSLECSHAVTRSLRLLYELVFAPHKSSHPSVATSLKYICMIAACLWHTQQLLIWHCWTSYQVSAFISCLLSRKKRTPRKVWLKLRSQVQNDQSWYSHSQLSKISWSESSQTWFCASNDRVT